MGKRVQSQWDFGGAEPALEARKVHTVSDLTGQIRSVLESAIGKVWVSGEISNYRAQPSGHHYFTLKDASAQLACVLFRNDSVPTRGLLDDGRKVILGGELTVYEARGQYQLRVTSVEVQGIGALQIAFERLKQKLQAEGLFEKARKRPIPAWPQRIGIVTSKSGAAIQDVLHVISRRAPFLEIVLASCRVQGDGAAREMIAAVEDLNVWSARGGKLDLILLTRGGGSLEDLWAFNDEQLARAIVASRLPVVSAVGHEIDFTIADFVADLRAATPSAAAEILTQNVSQVRDFLPDASDRLSALTRRKLRDAADKLKVDARTLARLHPRRRLQEMAQQLDDASDRLDQSRLLFIERRNSALRELQSRLGALKPSQVIAQARLKLDLARNRLSEASKLAIANRKALLSQAGAALGHLSPQNTLARGYSITFDQQTGEILRKTSQAQKGQLLRTQLADGSITSKVGA